MQGYVEVVGLMNFIVDFLLLLGTNRLSGFPPNILRAALAAALGGVHGGICLLPSFRYLDQTVWRIPIVLIMCVIAFGWNRSAPRRGALFVLLHMAMLGVSVGFGDRSFILLLISAALIFILCSVGFHAGAGQREFIPVKLQWGDKQIQVIALKDTGNTLRDPLTGEQILVAGADVGENLLGLRREQFGDPVQTLADSQIPGLRLIPYSSVGQQGKMMLGIRIHKAVIGSKSSTALVAFAPSELAHGEIYQMLAGGM